MNERITIRVTAEMKAALERFHQDQVVPVRSRQDAFRYIIEDWLIGHEPSDYVRSAILFSSKHLTPVEKKTCKRAWGGHNAINTLIAQTV